MKNVFLTTDSFKIFRDIIEENEDGYMIMDNEGTIVYANVEYLRQCECEAKDMIGRKMQSFITGGQLSESLALQCLKQKKKLVKPLMILEGSRPLSIMAMPVFDDAKNITYVVVRTKNVSQLVAMKKELDELEALVKGYEQAGIGATFDDPNIIAVSEEMKKVFQVAGKVGAFASNVIITGESGTGKEVVARYIHKSGNRSSKPYVAINCSALPEQLLETELFGYVGGTFTGAHKHGKKGLFEIVDGGVLFMDEVGEMSLNLQAKLLRVLENRVIVRVGDYKEIPVDVHIIAATNRTLEEMVKDKSFREDLYYRLNVITIKVPPLRERMDDIIPLSLFFLKQFNKQYMLSKTLSDEVLKALVAYSWPGNVRELKNFLERLIVLNSSSIINVDDLPFERQTEIHNKDIIVNELMNYHDAVVLLEKELLRKAKNEYKTCRKIAGVLGIDYSTVSRKLKQYGLNNK